MNQPNSNRTPARAVTPRCMPLLLFLFLGSGCAALIYEIVWLQLLQLVIGASAVSLGVLLGTFMGGMCLGSLALARIIPERCHPLRVYALLESGMAVLGVTVLFAVPAVGRVYAPHASQGLTGIVLRGLVASVCLLPPTFLMGATLPAISRWVRSTAQGMSWLGLFYAGNTVGAVVGCLLAGFYLLRKYDMATATGVAVAINCCVALSAFGLAWRNPHWSAPAEEKAAPPPPAPGANWVYVTIAVSGLCALAAEVIWTRLLSLMLGATVYTFSIILAVFLAGLGLGSTAGSLLARSTPRPRLFLGWCQILLAAAMAYAAWMLTSSLPYWPVNPSWPPIPRTLSNSIWCVPCGRCSRRRCSGARVFRSLWPRWRRGARTRAIGGQGVRRQHRRSDHWRAGGQPDHDRLGGHTANPARAHRLVLPLRPAPAALLLPGPYDGHCFRGTITIPTPVGNSSSHLFDAGGLGLAVLLVASVPPVPWRLVALGRYLAVYGEDRTLLYMGEGMNASVAVTKMNGGGCPQFSHQRQDRSLHRSPGHATAAHARPFARVDSSASPLYSGRRLRGGGHGRLFSDLSRGHQRRHLRNRTLDPLGHRRLFHEARITMSATTRVSKSCSTTPAISSSPRMKNSTSSRPTPSIRGSKAPPLSTRAITSSCAGGI